MSKRLIEFGKLRNPSRPGKIRIFDDIFRNFLDGRLGAVQNTQIDKHDRFITSRQLPAAKPPTMVRQPTPARNDKHNVKMRVICTGMSVAGNFQHTEPAEQAQSLKIASLCKTIPRGRHINQTRNEKINRNIANGERKKNKTTARILGFNPLETIIILAKQLYRPPPLASRAKSISAKVGGSNQTIISKPNRCTTIPDFRRYIGSNVPNFAGEVKTGILLDLTLHKRGCIVQHNSKPQPHCYQQTAYFFLAGGTKNLS